MVAKTRSKTPKADSKPLKAAKGRVEKRAKQAKPVSKKIKHANKMARMAMATGDVAKEEIDRKKQRDLRTLYVRFIGPDYPADADSIKTMVHPDIKFVRVQRQTEKKIKYAFVEFSSEEQCSNAKTQIGLNEKVAGKIFVDFVGAKSKQASKTREMTSKKHRAINPMKLFISGLLEGMTEAKIRQLFPKSRSVVIPPSQSKKGSPSAYVQFANAGDAKAAFDASQKLIISKKGSDDSQHHMTVTYAKISKRQLKQNKLAKESKSVKQSEQKTKTKQEAAVKAEDDAEEVKEEENESGEDEDEEMENDEESDNEKDDGDDDESAEDEEVENDEESSGDED